jgi:pimeloyl-ACP methyl ester carboxylesterase
MPTGLSSVNEAAGRRRMGHGLRWLVGGVLALLILVIVLCLSGAAYEVIAASSDARAYPAPGRLVDVGGFRLHINCLGVGSPTVVLDAGLGETSLDWVLVQPELGSTTRVCAYDRAGMGWSDPSPRPRTASNIAEELHTLLVNANVAGPYVLVAHSLSGKYARMFALHHRDEVAGIVLVDARYEYMDAITTPAENRAFIDAVEGQGRQYALARRFGVARLFGANLAGTSSVPADTRKLMALLSTQGNAIAATTGEARARAASDSELRAAPGLGALPLVVLVSDQSIATTPHWADAQRRQTALSSVGRMTIASGSSHFIQLDQPHLVIASVRDVIARARSDLPHSSE